MASFESAPRISPFLWFNSNAEEAVDFYLSVFKNSRRVGQLLHDGNAAGPKGTPLTIAFDLDGQRFTALNGGPTYTFNPAVSFVIRCDNQDEVDYYWERLTSGGTEVQCGWLTDKFGVSWQVVPAKIGELIKKHKAMQAMMKMVKLDIAELKRAYEGG
jgi:predicted 3-demethylubiquinone-9 3-methyltransferase (glyoxalase superfamily)